PLELRLSHLKFIDPERFVKALQIHWLFIGITDFAAHQETASWNKYHFDTIELLALRLPGTHFGHFGQGGEHRRRGSAAFDITQRASTQTRCQRANPCKDNAL